MNPYLNNPTIAKLQQELMKPELSGKLVSDIVDDKGMQYVDLVQEGGGVLGIALVGYTYIMEQAGIRFCSLAGTSAGAINTLMLAGLGRVGEPVSEKTLGLLAEKDLFDFVDGDAHLKKLVQSFIDGRGGLKWRVAWNALRIWRILKTRLGINPGHHFHDWVAESLNAKGISTMAELQLHRSKMPRLYDRETGDEVHRQAALQIIASDITTKSKVTFPEMACLYWPEPDEVNPSCFVRASMSVPFFFEPYVLDNVPNAGMIESDLLPREKTLWRKYTGYRGKIPAKVHFVDGGMLSNFPIHAFHGGKSPKKPTFGARLSSWRNQAKPIESLGNMAGAMISTMRQLHDYDFLLQNPDYKQLICSIDCDMQLDEKGEPKFNWLDFNMPPERKVELFCLGASKAVAFLKGFDWKAYKKIRAGG